MGKMVKCPGCDALIRADTEDELVELVQKHSREVHNLEEPTREEVLASAQPD